MTTVTAGRLCASLCLLLTFACHAQETGSAATDPFAEARAKLQAAEAAHPGNTAEVASALEDLVRAQLNREAVDAETLALIKRELAVSEAAGGDQSGAFSGALATAAQVYDALSRPAEGRPYAERGLEIALKGFPDSDAVITAAYALASVCNSLADFPCAVRANEKAIAALRKPGTDHDWWLASTLSNLGDVKERMGDAAGAGVAMEESLAVAIRTRPDAPEIGILESNAGAYYLRRLQFDKAIPHLNRSIAILTRVFGADSPFVRSTLANVAEIHSRTGQFELAWKDFEQTIANPSVTADTLARLRANYARSLASGGNLSRAIDEGLAATKIGRVTFVLQARTLPERQALAYDHQRPGGLNTALSVVARHPAIETAAVYQEVVRSRALVAEEMARRQKNLNAANDPEVARLLKELSEARAAVLAAEGTPAGRPGHADAIAQATAKMEKIERSLAERSAAVRNDQRTSEVRLEDVRGNLPARSVLISYVQFARQAVEAVDPARADAASYLAFVLHPGGDKIAVYDLGEAKAINELVARARAAADQEAHAGGLGSIRNERAYREAGEALRKRIWDPLRDELKDTDLALVVPDGVLNLIPFSGLPDGKGYIVEHGPVIHMLTSERDLVPAEGSEHKSGLLALGGAAFGQADARQAASPLRGGPVPCEEFSKLGFRPLPGTSREVADISSTWKRWNADETSALVTGVAATRDRFLAEATHSRMLHVATHAFVLNSACGNGNPLLHSGLVFAGVNQSHESSILTAQQIASLDLSGVEWAVLSACNTGNGELTDGEGVLGLERAFRVAGARSVVMTLWPVDDEVTQRFMHELYGQRLGRHATTANSLWNAARSLLVARRAAHESTHPWYWAGFVASGGWE